MINLPPDLKFPVLVRPKLRGVRCFILNGEPLVKQGSTAITLPNRFMADILSGLPAFDGMIVVGSTLEATCAAVTSGAAMASNEAPEFRYHVFDLVTNGKYAFKERLNMTREYARACRKSVSFVVHKQIEDVAALIEFERNMVLGHYPGIVVRNPDATVGGIWSS